MCPSPFGNELAASHAPESFRLTARHKRTNQPQVLSRIPILAGRQKSKVHHDITTESNLSLHTYVRACTPHSQRTRHPPTPHQPTTQPNNQPTKQSTTHPPTQTNQGRRHWIDLNGAGVQVREQLARVRGGEGAIDDAFLRTHIHKYGFWKCQMAFIFFFQVSINQQFFLGRGRGRCGVWIGSGWLDGLLDRNQSLGRSIQYVE